MFKVLCVNTNNFIAENKTYPEAEDIAMETSTESENATNSYVILDDNDKYIAMVEDGMVFENEFADI